MVTDEQAAFRDPRRVGEIFLIALADPTQYQTALKRMVTPESLDAWGDFSEASQHLRAIPNMGTASIADKAYGADDVRYFKVLANVTKNYQIVGDTVTQGAAIITLVWRPEHGQWMVHAYGTDYVLPEHLPRTAT